MTSNRLTITAVRRDRFGGVFAHCLDSSGSRRRASFKLSVLREQNLAAGTIVQVKGEYVRWKHYSVLIVSQWDYAPAEAGDLLSLLEHHEYFRNIFHRKKSLEVLKKIYAQSPHELFLPLGEFNLESLSLKVGCRSALDLVSAWKSYKRKVSVLSTLFRERTSPVLNSVVRHLLSVEGLISASSVSIHAYRLSYAELSRVLEIFSIQQDSTTKFEHSILRKLHSELSLGRSVISIGELSLSRKEHSLLESEAYPLLSPQVVCKSGHVQLRGVSIIESKIREKFDEIGSHQPHRFTDYEIESEIESYVLRKRVEWPSRALDVVRVCVNNRVSCISGHQTYDKTSIVPLVASVQTYLTNCKTYVLYPAHAAHLKFESPIDKDFLQTISLSSDGVLDCEPHSNSLLIIDDAHSIPIPALYKVLKQISKPIRLLFIGRQNQRPFEPWGNAFQQIAAFYPCVMLDPVDSQDFSTSEFHFNSALGLEVVFSERKPDLELIKRSLRDGLQILCQSAPRASELNRLFQSQMHSDKAPDLIVGKSIFHIGDAVIINHSFVNQELASVTAVIKRVTMFSVVLRCEARSCTIDLEELNEGDLALAYALSSAQIGRLRFDNVLVDVAGAADNSYLTIGACVSAAERYCEVLASGEEISKLRNVDIGTLSQRIVPIIESSRGFAN